MLDEGGRGISAPPLFQLSEKNKLLCPLEQKFLGFPMVFFFASSHPLKFFSDYGLEYM